MAAEFEIEQEESRLDTSAPVSSDLTSDSEFMKFKRWYHQDIDNVLRWRKEAREDFRFYNGHQWESDDITLLQEQNRAPISINKIAPLVNAVVGSEINNRRVVRYIPREVGDSAANELLTAAGDWFRDEADAEDEESDAFSDNVICGMGWTNTRLDYIRDPDGFPVVERLDPLKMAWDCKACKPNLTDANRFWFIDDKPLDEAMRMFPNVDRDVLCADWAIESSYFTGDDLNSGGMIYDQTRARFYLGGQEDFVTDGAFSEFYVRIVELRYYELESYYRVESPKIHNPDFFNSLTSEASVVLAQLFLNKSEPMVSLSVKEYNRLKKIYPPIQETSERMQRKVAKRAFLGKKILEKTGLDVPKNSLGWEAMTGYFDKTQKRYYGIVRSTKDPQKWSNKFFSQTIFLLNSQAKGGIMAERQAFEDTREAELSWTRSDAITWVNSGQLEAIRPKPVAAFPSGFFQLFATTADAINTVTGISPEFIGTREVNQPGILESQRRQSTLNLLAGLFNSLRKYRKRQGLIILYLIQNRIPNGRLIRIIGEGKVKYVPFVREDLANADYDIIIDDAPTSPNEKERTFAVIKELL